MLSVDLGWGLPVVIWGTAIAGYLIAAIPSRDLFGIDLRILFLVQLLAVLFGLLVVGTFLKRRVTADA